jgi:DNA-binding NarL/FixJ family response regulator
VLVIDDSAVFRERVKVLLGRIDGVQVVGEAPHGRLGVAFARAYAPHVVLLDLRMPGMNGFDTLRHIKALAAPPRVIVLTNLSSATVRMHCLRLGADVFLTKRATFSKLPQILERIRDMRRTP